MKSEVSLNGGIADRVRKSRMILLKSLPFQLTAFLTIFGLVMLVGSFTYRLITTRSNELEKYSNLSRKEFSEISTLLRLELDKMTSEVEKEILSLQNVELTDSLVYSVIRLNEATTKLFYRIEFGHETPNGIVTYSSQKSDMSEYYVDRSVASSTESFTYFRNFLNKLMSEGSNNGLSFVSAPHSLRLTSIFPVMSNHANSVGMLSAELATWQINQLFAKRRSHLDTPIILINANGSLLAPSIENLNMFGDLGKLSDSTGILQWVQKARLTASNDSCLSFLADVGGAEGSYVYAKPVGFHDLVIVTIAPTKLIFKKFEDLTKIMRAFRLAGALFAVIGAVGIIVIVFISVTYSENTIESLHRRTKLN